MSMKTTKPEQYKKDLDQWITYIQARIDSCKKKGETRYEIGGGLYPVFIEDVREHFESRGYNTQDTFESGWDQDFTSVIFWW